MAMLFFPLRLKRKRFEQRRRDFPFGTFPVIQYGTSKYKIRQQPTDYSVRKYFTGDNKQTRETVVSSLAFGFNYYGDVGLPPREG